LDFILKEEEILNAGKYIKLFEDRKNFFIHRIIIEEILGKGPGTSGYSNRRIESYLNKVKISDGIDKTDLTPSLKHFIKSEMSLEQFFKQTLKLIY
jgi:hypothetical protein